MKLFSTFSPALRSNLSFLFASGLCFWAGLAGLLPVLPLYIESLGATGQEIGFVMASFAIGLLVARPTLSRLADERGRKLVLLTGLFAIAGAPFCYMLVDQLPAFGLPLGAVVLDGRLALMGLFRAFHGISIAAYVTAYSALIVDIAPPANRGELIGYMSLVNPLGMALGPALGSYLLDWAGFTVAFAVMGGLGLVGLALSSRVRESYEPDPEVLKNQPDQLFWRLLLTPRIRIPAIILFLVGLAFGTLSTFTPLYVREVGLELSFVGLIYTASAIASFGVRLLAGRASDRYGRGRFISMSLLLYSVAMVILWSAQGAPTFLIGGLVQGTAAGMLIPMIAALMADRSGATERGRIFGLCMVGFDLGIALAGPILGTLADTIGYRGVFGLSALMTALGFVIFVTASSKDIRHSLQFSLSRGRDVYAINQQ